MTYKHTREIDTFYEISQTGALQLPRSVSTGLQLNPNARHKAKVRITTNEKTGEELAKIVKTRVADIDVYSPRTLFDWRVSVNVEMDFDVDVRDLVAVEKRDGRADRRKDRVSYKHLQYQIDLTQVTPAEVGAFISKHCTSRWSLANITPSQPAKPTKNTNSKSKSRAPKSATRVFWSSTTNRTATKISSRASWITCVCWRGFARSRMGWNSELCANPCFRRWLLIV